jgi:hypothetical protein
MTVHVKTSLQFRYGLLTGLLSIAFLAGLVYAQPQLVGDMNKDFKVDLIDLRILARQWLEPVCLVPRCIADLDGYNGVNMADYALMAKSWLMEESHLVISEFMASNSKTILDGDDVASDWIEIYNPTG